MQIQWFPGHMAKTRKLITENLRLVDVVVEMLDARLPLSSRNPLLDEMIGDKPRVLVLAKGDLAEDVYNKAWVAYFRRQGLTAVACDFKGANPKRDIKAVTEGLRSQASGLMAKRQSRGIRDQVIRVMITGIPNVGKSTMINLFAGKARTETADRPGVTRGKQWIRLDKDLELLDMPGILWPNLEDREGARKLAVTGAIGENAFSQRELALWLIRWLKENRPGRLHTRYGIDEDMDGSVGMNESLGRRVDGDEDCMAWGREDLRYEDESEAPEDAWLTDVSAIAMLEAIGRRRGLLRKGGVVEMDKAAVILLDELRGGKLGRITWDEPPSSREPREHDADELPNDVEPSELDADETPSAKEPRVFDVSKLLGSQELSKLDADELIPGTQEMSEHGGE